jgi:hypothetical protein
MTDVLERIQQRETRPTVPPRDASLIAGTSVTPSDPSMPGHLDTPIPVNSDTSISGYQGIKTV